MVFEDRADGLLGLYGALLGAVLQEEYAQDLRDKRQRVHLVLRPKPVDRAIVKPDKPAEHAVVVYGALQQGLDPLRGEDGIGLFLQKADVAAVEDALLIEVIPVTVV